SLITRGANNTALGNVALNSNTTGSRNVGIGVQALQNNTAGTDRSGIGYEAAEGAAGYLAGGTVAIGTQAGSNLASNANSNRLRGYKSGLNITSGYGNIVIGAGVDVGNNISTGGNNIGLGNNIIVPSGSANTQLNIGNFLFGTLPATTSVTGLQV